MSATTGITNLIYNGYEFQNLLHFAGGKMGLSPISGKVQDLARHSHQAAHSFQVFTKSSLSTGISIVLCGAARQLFGFAYESETVSCYLLPAAFMGTAVGLVLASQPFTRNAAKKAENSLYETLEDRFKKAAMILPKPEAAHFAEKILKNKIAIKDELAGMHSTLSKGQIKNLVEILTNAAEKVQAEL